MWADMSKQDFHSMGYTENTFRKEMDNRGQRGDQVEVDYVQLEKQLDELDVCYEKKKVFRKSTNWTASRKWIAGIGFRTSTDGIMIPDFANSIICT